MIDPPPPFRGNRQLRKNRVSVTGCDYFITIGSFEHRPVLATPAAFEIICNCMDWMEAEGRWEWFCFTGMPDHFHMIFCLRQGSLGSVLDSFKTFTGKRIKIAADLSHPVWQRQYYDRLLRDNNEFMKARAYCYWNAWSRGLVVDPATYPFWRSKTPLGHTPLVERPW